MSSAKTSRSPASCECLRAEPVFGSRCGEGADQQEAPVGRRDQVVSWISGQDGHCLFLNGAELTLALRLWKADLHYRKKPKHATPTERELLSRVKPSVLT